MDDGFVNTRRDAAVIQGRYFKEIEDKSIQSLYPTVAKEWYQPKNGTITRPLFQRPLFHTRHCKVRPSIT